MLDSGADLSPQLFASGAGSGGEWNDLCLGKFLSQRPESVAQLISRQPVTLGADDHEVAVTLLQKLQKLLIALLRRDVYIDQGHAQRQGRPFFQIRLDETRPLA